VIDSVMLVDLENLPSDPQLLQRLVRDMAAAVESRDGEIERLQSIIRKLQRTQFGRSSERLDSDQLALALEDLDADIARIQESRPFVGKPLAERWKCIPGSIEGTMERQGWTLV
jgi:transposase